MGRARACETSKPRLQLPLVGGSEADVAHLQDLLKRTNHDQLHCERACSPEDAFAQVAERNYEVLLRSSQCDDRAALQLLRQVRTHDSRVPGVFLSDRASDGPTAESGRQSVETLRKLWLAVEQSSELVMIIDRLGAMEYVNPAFETLTGYSRQEAIGQPPAILQSGQQGKELYEEMWNTVLCGKVFRGTVSHRRKNGEIFILEQTLTPLRGPAGNITHFICAGQDITDQRRMQLELQQAQKMDAIGRLAGGVAHDFNNMLLIIGANAELMLDSLAVEHPLRHNVTEIMSASRRAADLTRQLLAFGRKQVQSLQVLDLNSVVGEITDMLPHLIGEDIELVFAPGETLGRVKSDPMQIEQMVMNLAANARDAMPAGGKLIIETANVQLEETHTKRDAIVPAGHYVLLTVTDSGEGIPPEHLSYVFEPFYTTKEAGKGTGLGLATVDGIVKQNGGFVRVYSEPGRGTTFKIYLPRVQSVDGKRGVLAAEEDVPAGCETLLLVEDEPGARESTREFLVQIGYTVLLAEDGEAGLRASRKHRGPIHLMISDVVMPRMSGPKLAQQLVCERPEMKALYVSGYGETTVLRYGLIDVTRFLQKPFSLRALARKVREVLETSESLACAATSLG